MVKQVVKLLAKLGTWRLTLVADEQEKEFTLDELKKLPNQEITVQLTSCPCSRHTYRGVALSVLLTASEIDPAAVQSVRAMASDGTGIDYGPGELTAESPLLAWELDGAALPEELGTVALVSLDEPQVKRLERVVVALSAEGD